MTSAQFRKIAWAHYQKHGRHDLPWRQTRDVYRILVSEVMLQQTQVDRVIPYYKNFIKKFPTAKVLAAAPLSDVLKAWQGLGYNRRAKMLHQAAKQLNMGRSDLPIRDVVSELEGLPGVGHYTARAIAAFAYNQEVIVIETNIRTAVIHHFFAVPARGISDTEIEEILKKVLPRGRSREWYSALMDYGAHLKRSGISYNARGKGYAKQSKFAGSLRQVRGVILRALAESQQSEILLTKFLGEDRQVQVHSALEALLSEGLIQKRRGQYLLAE